MSNLPSLKIEECTPVTVSTQGLLAPEEIFDKGSRDVKGDAEKTSTDKKRERREKKAKKREQIKEKTKKTKQREILKPSNLKHQSKSMALESIKALNKNATIIDGDSQLKNTFKSSSAFFTQLQENVDESVSSIKAKAEKKEKRKQRAEQMKL